MLFNSLNYIVFLGIAVVLYWLLEGHTRTRLGVMLLLSCAFYMAWNPAYIGLILFSALLDYGVARRIAASEEPLRRKAWLAVSLTGNLGLLGVFKYYNFFVDVVGDTFGLFGASVSLPLLDVLLPVGISFYTFQTLSYTIDVYRGTLQPRESLLEFALFVTYFPQLVAGPIVRAADLLPQLELRPRLRKDQASEGLFLIITGLVKKVAIADYLSVNLVDRVFDNPEMFTASEVVIGLYAFTMQIYCDFSGYTDVARGSAKLMGLELPENFDRPYQSTNPAEFWRRWHMTLSTWLRDYLYFPLGGSKGAPARAYWNLWITMFLIGLWHGASWNFVIYGALQAFAMVLHRYFHRRAGRTRDAVDSSAVRAFKVFACLQFVVFSRILFRAVDLDNAREVTERLFSGTRSVAQVSLEVWVVLVGTFLLHYTPRRWFDALRERFVLLPAPAQGLALGTSAAALSLVATSAVVPYIYFQF